MAFSSKVFALVLVLATVKLSAQNKDSVLTSGGKLRPEQAIMDIRHYTIQLGIDFRALLRTRETLRSFVFTRFTNMIFYRFHAL